MGWFDKGNDQPASEEKKQTRILLVEDEVFLAELFQVALKSEDIIVDTIYDGAQVMEKVEQESYDLIFLDLTLPHKDGFQLLEELRKIPRYQHIPIIILTNHGEIEQMKKAKSLGSTDFLIKSNMDYTQLQNVIKRYLQEEVQVNLPKVLGG